MFTINYTLFDAISKKYVRKLIICKDSHHLFHSVLNNLFTGTRTFIGGV